MIKQKLKLNTIPSVTKYDKYRQKVIDELNKTDLRKDFMTKMEQTLYQKTMIQAEKLCVNPNMNNSDFSRLYMSICRHVISNLKIGNCINNEQFVKDINANIINIETIATMTPQEMCRDKWRHLVQKKLFDIEKLSNGPEATTDMFRCGKCHQNKCTYFERQDRSSDEPMTIHITCCNCGKKWKQ
jgi:DNA-directed RNA polymerase subunit M/transcription elongation factor TFIIS